MFDPNSVLRAIHEENQPFYGTELGRGALKDLQRDFPYPWLYVAELLQNAVDAGARIIRLEPDPQTGQFVFEHDGEAFTEKNVRALCSKGVSTKGAGTVGFMGVGFKAVFHSYQRVDVSSGSWRFFLEVPVSIGQTYGDRQRDWVGSVLPNLDPGIEPPTEGMTCRFVLRDRLNAHETPDDDINHILSSMDLLPLLAHRGIERLEVGRQKWILAKRHPIDVAESVSQTILEVLDEVTEDVHQWVLFSARYRPSPEAIGRFLEHRQLNLDDPQMSLEERRKGREEAAQDRAVDLFCSLATNGYPVPPQRAHLFALLSTSVASPVGLHMQADWLLVTTRHELVDPENNPWHQEICAQLPMLLRAFLGWVCTIENVPEERLPKSYGVLPDLTDMTEVPSRWIRTPVFKEALRQSLAGLAFLPSRTAEGMRFITVEYARLLPAPLDGFDDPGLQGWVLFGPHIVSATLLGDRALACLKVLGFLSDLAPQELAAQWEGGTVGNWRSKLGDQGRGALLHLLAALAKLDTSDVWRNTELRCLPSQQGGWVHRGIAKRLPGDWNSVPEESPAVKTWLMPFLPPVEETLAWRLERSLQQDSEASQYVKNIVAVSLETVVAAWWESLPERLDQHDVGRVIAFTNWVRTKHRQRVSLVRKVICDADNGIMLLPWREAALADPYTSKARRRFFQDRKFVSTLYLESDQLASAADWQSFFETTSPELAGRFLVCWSAQELSFPGVQQALPEYSPPSRRSTLMSPQPKWNGKEFSSSRYLLVDYHLPPQLRDILDDEITSEIADDILQWLYEERHSLHPQCKRKLVYVPHNKSRPQEQELPFAASWIKMLQEKRWVWDQQGTGPYTPQEVLPGVDEARPEAAVVNLPNELVTILERCGVAFGTAISDVPALERLRRESPRAVATRIYELLQTALTAVDEDDEGLETLRRLLENTPLLPVPRNIRLIDQDSGARIPASRLVYTALQQRDFGSWLVPVSALPEGSAERRLADLIGRVFDIPREPTPPQALAFLEWVWRNDPDAETVRRLLPQAYRLLHEGVEQQALAEARIEAALHDARVFTRGRQWIPVREGRVYLDDIGNEQLRELPSTRVNFATGSHLGETSAEQKRTANLLDLPLLSSRFGLEPRAVSERPADQEWQAGFRQIHDYLLLRTSRDEGDEDSTILPLRHLSLGRCEGLHLAVLEDGEPVAHWDVKAACLHGRAVVVGEPVNFMAELCTALLKVHDLSARRNLNSLGPEITQLLGLLDNPEKLQRCLVELRRKYGLQPGTSAEDCGRANEELASASEQAAEILDHEGASKSGAGTCSPDGKFKDQIEVTIQAPTPDESDRADAVEEDGTFIPTVTTEITPPRRKGEDPQGRAPDNQEGNLFPNGGRAVWSPQERSNPSLNEHTNRLPGQPVGTSYTEERSDARLLSYIRNLLSVGVNPSIVEPGYDGDGSSDERGQFGSDKIFREATLAFERDRGRFPMPKTAGQPGHDIDSFTHPEGHPDRKLARRIEVKGRNSPWTDAEIIELSSRQFRDALERSVESDALLAADFDFWLYVVEPDESGGYRVLPIRNPARLGARYQFRGGVWRHFAEQT